MLSLNKTNFPIGLDISDLSLKLVQLKKKSDKIKIQAIGKTELTKGMIDMGQIKNSDEMINKIKELISKPKFGSISTNEVVACLPDTKTFIKLIEIEKSVNDLADIIPSEIEKHVPLSTKEIYYDWQIVNSWPDKYSVLIGAAPQSIVNQYIDILSRSGLNLIGLEVESIAICRCLLAEENNKNKNQTRKNYAIIDIGAKRASLTIYAKNTIVLSVSMPISGEQITEKIAKTLEIKYDQAEKAKIICGLDKTKAQGIIYEILSEMLLDLNTKIKESIEFYNNHYPDLGPINEIIICGGGANIKNIELSIGEFNSVNAFLGNVFMNLSENIDNCPHQFTETHNLHTHLINDKQDKDLAVKQNSSLSYATAIGLALRQFYTG